MDVENHEVSKFVEVHKKLPNDGKWYQMSIVCDFITVSILNGGIGLVTKILSPEVGLLI